METDPFASIVDCCRITRSGEESLSTCGFAGRIEGPEGGGSEDSESEELTQPDLHPIIILSLPDSQSQPVGNAEPSSHDEDCTAALPTSCDAGADAQNAVDLGKDKDSLGPMDCETALRVVSETDDASDAGADAQNAFDLGRDKDSSVPMDCEMAQRVASETDNASSDTAVENYRVEKRGINLDDSIEIEVLCSHLKVIRGPETSSRSFRLQGKAQNGQENAIKDAPRPSKKKKIDILNVLKEIAGH